MIKKKLINFRPFVAIAIAMVCGILCSLFSLTHGKIVVIIPLLVLGVLCGIFLFIGKDNMKRFMLFVVFAAFLVGVAVSSIKSYKIMSDFSYDDNAMHIVSGKIISVDYYENYDLYSYVIETPTIDGKKISSNIEMSLKGKEYEKGSELSFKAKLSSIDLADFSNYFPDNVALIARVSGNIDFLGTNYNFFENINAKIKSVIFANMGEQAPIAFALMTGDSSYIASDELQNLRFSGIAHIFAVSGLHIGFLVSILSFLFEHLKLKRYRKVILIFIITFAYAGICGFTASSLRAVIMSAVLMSSNASGRKYDLLTSLSMAAIILLMFMPFELMTVGFLLSFGCVASVALFYKTFQNCFKIGNEKLKNAVALSCSVQIGILPLGCYFFGYASVASILLNLIVVPIISLLYPILTITALLSAIFPFLRFSLFVPEVIISFIRFFMSLFQFERLISKISFNLLQVFGYYAIAIFASDKLNFGKRVKFLSVLSSVIYLIIFAI